MADMLTVTNMPTFAVHPDQLLTTKLFAPRVRPDRVPRPRLTDRLDQGLQHKVILVSAPAGFGKTTLLGEWREALMQRRVAVAWLSLDDGDNDLARLLMYLIGALQTIRADVGRTSLSSLYSRHMPSPESILTNLINELAQVPEECALILDDYHVIESPPAHSAIEFLIEHLPPHIHLVIASRAEPPLALPRLRGRNELAELHAADLRLTPAETSTFLNQVMGLGLSPDDIATLDTYTEGWVAGLQLAALSLRGQPNIAELVAGFSGRDRFIFDYLAEEVLHRQTEDMQTFLLQTSILDRLCAGLCDAVMDRTDSQTMLERLDRANLFIVPLDNERRWYRYHHLFTELLRDRLQRWQPERVCELHRRASRWYERQQLISQAIVHALAAQDFEAAADLIEPMARSLLARGEVKTLLSWLDALPDEVVLARSALCLAHAWSLASDTQPERLEHRLQALEHAAPGEDPSRVAGEVAAIRATLAARSGDPDRTIELSRKALEQLPEDDLFSRGISDVNLGIAHMLSGNAHTAGQYFQRGAELSQAAGNQHATLKALNNLAVMQVLGGKLHAAAQTYRRALHATAGRTDTNDRPVAIAGMIHIGLSELAYEWNDLETAEREAQLGMALCQYSAQATDEQTQLAGYLIRSRLQQAQGDLAGALETVERGRQFAETCSQHWVTTGDLQAMRARLQVMRGDIEAAARWVEASDLRPDAKAECLRSNCFGYATLARVLIAQGRHHPAGPAVRDAGRLLDRMLHALQAVEQTGSEIEVLALQALALQAQGDVENALAALRQALSLAEPERYVRTFADEGEHLAQLLDRIGHERGNLKTYVEKLLSVMRPAKSNPLIAPTASPALIEPLSQRELQVLQLIATGLSNQEVAQKMVVAVSTVKWHLNNIYAKLDVRNRTRAVARAQGLGLLSQLPSHQRSLRA